MGLILSIAGAALALVHAYNKLRDAEGDELTETIASVKQGAGVVYALSKAVFDILNALQGIRSLGGSSTTTAGVASSVASRFGTTAGQLEAARA